MRGATVLAALLLAGCATVVQGPPAASLADGCTGTIAFRTMSLTSRQALLGERGDNAVITGELVLPRGDSAGVPAVVLMHGAGGVQDYHYLWARELRSIGFATFLVDSFSGRSIGKLVENLEPLKPYLRIRGSTERIWRRSGTSCQGWKSVTGQFLDGPHSVGAPSTIEIDVMTGI